MKTAFVLKRRYYLEEYYKLSTPIAVSLTQEPLEKLRAEIVAKNTRFNELREQVGAFGNAYNETHPRPPYDRSQIKDIPRWPSGIRQEDITPAMRRERDALATHNEKISKAHDVLVKEWEAIKAQAVKEFMVSLGLNGFDEEIYNQYEGYSENPAPTEFFIEPIDLVE